WTRRAFGRPSLALLLVVAAGLAASRYARGVGRDNAWQDAHVSTCRLPFVILEGNDEESGSGCSLSESNYRLLVHSNEEIYVVLPVDDTQRSPASNLRVCGFPQSRIKAMRIQVGLEER